MFLATRVRAWPIYIACLLGPQMLTSGSSMLSRLVVGVGIKQNAKCEMLLRKTDVKMNVQNCGFSMKLRNGDGGDMTDGNGSCHGLVPSFFDDMTFCQHKKIAGDDQATLMVDRNSAIYVCLQDRN